MCRVSSQLIAVLIQKKNDREKSFIPTPRKRLRGQKTSVGITLIELTGLNYKPFFKHCILQTILYVFLVFIIVWNKIFCFKN